MLIIDCFDDVVLAHFVDFFCVCVCASFPLVICNVMRQNIYKVFAPVLVPCAWNWCTIIVNV